MDPYLAIALLVFGDAICALLPGETALNAAPTLAADGALELWLMIIVLRRSGRAEPA